MNHNTGRASTRMPDTRWTINMGVIAVFVCILEITVHVLKYSQPPLSASSTSTDSTKLRPKILKKKKKIQKIWKSKPWICHRMATIYLAFSLYLKLVTWHLHGVRYYKKFRDDFKYMRRDFPGCPVVNISSSSAGGRGSIPGWEAKFPHASQPKSQKEKNP